MKQSGNIHDSGIMFRNEKQFSEVIFGLECIEQLS